MKKLAWILAVPVLMAGLGRAQTSPPANNSEGDASRDRMFFPRDMLYGWAQFELAPPHNEIDPNLCAATAGQYGGVNAPCSMFARYMLSGTLEVRPFGRGQLRRFMLFGSPTFLFGKNLPQTLYTWSFDAIGIELRHFHRLADQAVQARALLIENGEHLVPLTFFERGLRQQAGRRRANGGERRAQFVGH